MFSTSKNTTSIQSAILYAGTNNYAGIVIPQAYLPYDTSTISDVYLVQRFRERGPWDKWDVRAYGAAGDGIDDTAALTAAVAAAPSGAVVWFGETGTFSITTTLDPIGTTKTLRFEGHYTERSNAPILSGNFNGPLIRTHTAGGQLGGEMGCAVRGLRLQNASSASSSICIDFQNVMNLIIEDCFVHTSGHGIILRASIFNASIRNCSLVGTITNDSAIGLYTPGHSHIESITAVGWGHAVRIPCSGPTTVLNSRLESNATALEVGLDLDGNGSGGGGATVIGSSWEGNDTSLYLSTINGCLFAGLSIAMTASAPSGAGIYGMNIAGNQLKCHFAGIGVGGSCTSAVVYIDRDATFSSMVDVLASLTSGSGTTWKYNGTPKGWEFQNCNAPAIIPKISDGSTVPDIRHSTFGSGRIWTTTNTSATTITDFQNGLAGYSMTLKAGDANTGLQHGTNIFLKSGADKRLANNETISLMKFDSSTSRWDEI